MTEEELVALMAIRNITIDVCWDCYTNAWSGIVVYDDSKFFTESSPNKKRLLHEIAIRVLKDAYDGKGIICADN